LPGGGFQKLLLLAGVEYSSANRLLRFLPPSCSCHIHSAHVAKPSLSQIWRQRFSETESPNHWWAISCATVSALGAVS